VYWSKHCWSFIVNKINLLQHIPIKTGNNKIVSYFLLFETALFSGSGNFIALVLLGFSLTLIKRFTHLLIPKQIPKLGFPKASILLRFKMVYKTFV